MKHPHLHKAHTARPAALCLFGIFLILYFLASTCVVSACQTTVAWDPENSPGLAGYKVYWGTVSRNYAWSADAGMQTTYTITGLTEGITYYFAVTAYDGTRAESSFSNEVPYTVPTDCANNVIPHNLSSNTEAGMSATAASGGGGGGGGGGGACFIATAAYGSYLHPHVKVLRDFRDAYLLTNRVGTAFVSFYYRYSPPVAAFIGSHGVFKIIVRVLLTPLVYSLKYPYGLALVTFAGVLTRLNKRKSKTAKRPRVL